MNDGQKGFCGVRKNIEGTLNSLIYGKTVQLTQETIETEAVFHYAPGAPILSLGNIGCMLACDFCQNWKTAQVKYLDENEIHYHTPEQVVDIALQRGIQILSWTYNDPVVWFEFVMDTARLARQKGLKNLFKSSFFISIEAAAELCNVIDVFSISIKSMDEEFYRRLTKGWLPPVLEATKLVFANGKHVEISNLLITDLNDSEDDVKRMASWVLDNLSDKVPLHFVRFHPDYKYTQVPTKDSPRTSI
jgi:pyruvate formate lyase activating enzyme